MDSVLYPEGGEIGSGFRCFWAGCGWEKLCGCGASTGGFSDCLLQHGAIKVYAIDVGKGILHWKLRNHPRVVVMEGTNARYVEALPEPVSFVSIDASFISLKILLPVVKSWFAIDGGGPDTDIQGDVVALIKPQFEAGRKEVARGKGVIRDPIIHQKVLWMCFRLRSKLVTLSEGWNGLRYSVQRETWSFWFGCKFPEAQTCRKFQLRPWFPGLLNSGVELSMIKKDRMFYRFSAYGFLKNLRFFEPFIILIFRDNGLTFLQIGLLYSIRDLANNILEIPTGVFADTFGRRKAMVLAFLAYIISFFIFFAFRDFYIYAGAMIIFAFGEAFPFWHP